MIWLSRWMITVVVFFVTAFSGLFAPYWIDDAKGTICEFFPLLTKLYPITASGTDSTTK